MASLRQRSAEHGGSVEYIFGGIDKEDNRPLVAAAWALAAARSRLNALSAAPFSSIWSLANRRCRVDRRAGERVWRARCTPKRDVFMVGVVGLSIERRWWKCGLR